MPAPHYSLFTGRMPFLMSNQQCQSTDVKMNNPVKAITNNIKHITQLHTEQKVSVINVPKNANHAIYDETTLTVFSP